MAMLWTCTSVGDLQFTAIHTTCYILHTTCYTLHNTHCILSTVHSTLHIVHPIWHIPFQHRSIPYHYSLHSVTPGFALCMESRGLEEEFYCDSVFLRSWSVPMPFFKYKLRRGYSCPWLVIFTLVKTCLKKSRLRVTLRPLVRVWFRSTDTIPWA